ncbi:ABC transporter permease [Candidatus Nanohalobium constans]|uniref:ABC transport system permease protein n=1 Tax=Candidatus Nanohalobium constans TaxID=2565781 RepID=A0A5Q0UG15_9ARCH|nr:ABC transporter permease [Candidatus Nanohalobium constans]QGA79939.1 ABC transport system permease protein [Candidatus Nanohalobium constans]
MFLDFFRLSINNLRHRKRRSWLTIIGTLIGIMAVVSLISIGQGLENSVASELEELGGNKLFISSSGGVSGRFAETTFGLNEDDKQAIERVKEIKGVAGGISGGIDAKYRRDTEKTSLRGITTGRNADIAKEIYDIEVVEGRYLATGDTSSVVIAEDAKNDIFEDEIILNSKIDINGTDYKVVGVISTSQTVGNFQGLVGPLEETRDVLNRPEGYDFVTAEVSDGETTSEVAEKVRKELRNERGIEKGEETFQIETAQDIIDSFKNQLSIIRAVLLGIGAISLLVGGVGIMNTMYTSVSEREREIGVMKAIGATKKQILALFMIESGMVGMIGGLLGATVGIGLSYVAAALIKSSVSLPFQPYVSPELVFGAIFFSFIVGMISGALPARKASKKEPVEALRSG